MLFLYLYQQLLLKESQFYFGYVGGKKCINIRRTDKTQQGHLVPYRTAMLRLEEFPELSPSCHATQQPHRRGIWRQPMLLM